MRPALRPRAQGQHPPLSRRRPANSARLRAAHATRGRAATAPSTTRAGAATAIRWRLRTGRRTTAARNCAGCTRTLTGFRPDGGPDPGRSNIWPWSWAVRKRAWPVNFPGCGGRGAKLPAATGRHSARGRACELAIWQVSIPARAKTGSQPQRGCDGPEVFNWLWLSVGMCVGPGGRLSKTYIFFNSLR